MLPLGSAVRSSSRRSPVTVPGWCQYTRPPKAFAQQDVWSWFLAPVRLTVPSVWTSRDLCCPSPAAVAAPVVVSAPVAVDLLFVVAAFLLLFVDILGSLGMPFRRGQHLIRVSRPIGSPPWHMPGRIRLLAYLLHKTRHRMRSKHLRAYAPQDLLLTRDLASRLL